MSIANDKIVNLQDAKVLYDDLRGRIEQSIVDTNTYEKTISEASAIQSFDDGSEWPMGMQIAVDPVQDLHGYSNPWPGGGGKNLLPKGSTSTVSGITFTVNDDGTVLVTGTSTSSASVFWGTAVTLPAGNYILNGCPSGGGVDSYRIDVRKSVAGEMVSQNADTGNGANVTISEAASVYVCIRVAANYAFPSAGLLFKPMIRLSTETDATYAPYENICPISGWTVANVSVTGKNLWSGFIAGKRWLADGTETTGSENTYAGTNKIRINNNLNFKLFSDTLTNGSVVAMCFEEDGTFIEEVIVSSSNTLTKDLNVPITLPSGTTHVAFRTYRSSANGGVSAYTTAQIMLTYEEAI